jgi:hypothetical protein
MQQGVGSSILGTSVILKTDIVQAPSSKNFVKEKKRFDIPYEPSDCREY